MAAVTPPQPNEAGDAAIIQVIPTTSPQDQATTDLVQRLRDETIPAATPEGAVVHVGGGTATFIDLSDRITNALPWFIGAVVLLSFLLLMVVFRSILVPLKAAVLNLLSIGAAYGVVVAIFQWGWGRSLLGIDQLIPIVSFVPMMMFAVLFGLSMDYEVFLLSRIREEYLKTGKNVESVVSGISTTARVITSAALIMIAVFLSFVIQPDPVGEDVRHRPGGRGVHRRDDRPDRAGAGHDGAPGRRELVAPRLAGPDPAEDEPGDGVRPRGSTSTRSRSRSARPVTSRAGPLQERVGLRERGGRTEPFEDLSGVPQDRCGLGRAGKPEQTPAMPEQRERLLRNDAEPFPTIGGIGVTFGSGLQVTVSFGQRCVGRDEGVLGVGVARLEPADETFGKCGVRDPQGGANEGGKVHGVREGLAGAGCRLDPNE